MKKQLTALALLSAISPFVMAADVTLNFAGLNQVSGDLYIGVYASADDMRTRKSIQSQIVSVHKSQQKAVLADLPLGSYGVMVFQDLDGNGDLNTNVINIPTEPYGFSTNPSIMGPPSFEDIRFDVNNTSVNLTINME